ncbi:PUA domain protein [uncultured archaeon]|nr:PUA domain protein [uncultured archaeon]
MKKQLSKSDIEKLNQEISLQFGVSDFFGKKDRIAIAEINQQSYVVKDDLLCFFYLDGKLVPTLKLLLQRQFLKQVTVDMGAVKFVSAGADVMRPGIVELDHDIKKGEYVAVVDQAHKKPLCIAQALFSGEEIFTLKQGKVLKAVHWVGDSIWQIVP